MTFWAIATRYASEPTWLIGQRIYETRADAVTAAHEQWDGTGVMWRLVSIPGEEKEASA